MKNATIDTERADGVKLPNKMKSAGTYGWLAGRTIKPMTLNGVPRGDERLDGGPEKLSIPFDHDMTRDNVRRRLNAEAARHDLVVAFDFDNTLYKYVKGEPLRYSEDMQSMTHSCVLSLLKAAQAASMTLVLFSTEEDEAKLADKQAFCRELGLKVDWVNSSPLFPGAKKPYYNILLDDRAGLQESFELLLGAINYVNAHKTNRDEGDITL